MTKERYIFEENNIRLDVYLSDITDYSRSRIKKLIDKGAVTVNGGIVKGGKNLKYNDVIEIVIPAIDEDSDMLLPENIPLDILYEDNDLAVINKQCGLVVHPGGGAVTGTLVNAILFHIRNLSARGGDIRPGIVHRLDKDTSGVMVVAKNDYAHESLSKQISEKTAVRTYVALLEGVLKNESGIIDKNIIRNPLRRKEFRTCGSTEGRTALTYYKVLSRYRKYTLTEFVLGTGRTHQIRVHAKYIGHPVVCDPVYGYRKQRFEHVGQLLHSASLEFDHPVTRERMRFFAPLPDYFEETIAQVSVE